jgi:AcrR family transcriptional regulator
MRSAPPPPSRTPAADPPARIVAAARRHFFQLGFAGCTMDCIARELGMSKKTLYAHFRTKDDLVSAVLDAKIADFVGGLDALVGNRELGVADRTQQILAHVAGQMAEVSPAFLRDLQRLMPALFARMEAVRAENLPRVWGHLIRDGIARSQVRTDIDPAFVAAMLLTSAQNLLRPAALEQLNLTPRDVILRLLDVVNHGILTPAGRKAYEKNLR